MRHRALKGGNNDNEIKNAETNWTAVALCETEVIA
jgi:hypothetical protein